MKKYIKPVISVYNIEAENMMAASGGTRDGDSLGNSYNSDNALQLSKGHKTDVWGFDEEDED